MAKYCVINFVKVIYATQEPGESLVPYFSKYDL